MKNAKPEGDYFRPRKGEMKADEIRERFLKFFEERGHVIYPSDSLVPRNDPTLLFTGAGMNQFKEEFLGRAKGSLRVATCQKCLRTGDLGNVGKTAGHHTFFEMLGNFSFGDYFKKEAILWAWEFLTKELGLRESDLWVSVYRDDDEAYDIWKKVIKVPAEKILKLGEKENFWPSNAPSKGPDGLCGPCSEIFYGGKDGVEIWNLVFTQFDRKDKGKLEPLPNKNIDTGMGLERIARIMQGKKTNFEIDSFLPIIGAVRELLKEEAGDTLKTDRERYINAISDHVRAVTFAIADGVLPSNEERGYVIRKLIRKAFWYGRTLGMEKPFLYKLVPVTAKVMERAYPELTKAREDIAQAIYVEEKRFRNTISEGLERLNNMIDGSRVTGALSGKDVFKLYDTYGFPLELTEEIARTENINVDLKGFESSMKEQRSKSRKNSKIEGSIFAIEKDLKIELPDTLFVDDAEEIETRVAKVLVSPGSKETGNYFVFLEKTNFYGEKGGQVGDTGILIKDDKVIAEVINAIDIAGRIQHEVKLKKGVLKAGDEVAARIDLERRENIKKNHTATHLLHSALRKVLGQHVKQSGSLVAPDRLRFDFTHFEALAPEELFRIGELVNKYIKENGSVETRKMKFDEAKREGVIALFGEKYQDAVKMVSIGEDSKELCGGTHVKKAGEIAVFKIISESAIASGVRRIEAVTGKAACKKIREENLMIEQIARELEALPENIVEKIEKLNSRLKKMEKELETVRKRAAHSNTATLLDNAKEIKGSKVMVKEINNADMGLLRESAGIIRGKIKKGVYVLLSEKDGKFSMVVGVCGEHKINAVKVLNDIGSGFGIKGGGRPDFAQAGSRSRVDVKVILNKAEEIIGEYL